MIFLAVASLSHSVHGHDSGDMTVLEVFDDGASSHRTKELYVTACYPLMLMLHTSFVVRRSHVPYPESRIKSDLRWES